MYFDATLFEKVTDECFFCFLLLGRDCQLILDFLGRIEHLPGQLVTISRLLFKVAHLFVANLAQCFVQPREAPDVDSTLSFLVVDPLVEVDPDDLA